MRRREHVSSSRKVRSGGAVAEVLKLDGSRCARVKKTRADNRLFTNSLVGAPLEAPSRGSADTPSVATAICARATRRQVCALTSNSQRCAAEIDSMVLSDVDVVLVGLHDRRREERPPLDEAGAARASAIRPQMQAHCCHNDRLMARAVLGVVNEQ
jgi:hypothetical protein